MHAKGVKIHAGIRSTFWCVWFQVYKAIKGPVLLTIAGWAGPCWIDLCVCVCVRHTSKIKQVLYLVSMMSFLLLSWIIAHCPFHTIYIYILMYGVRDMIIIVWEPWMMAVLDLNVWLMLKVVKQDDGFNSSRVGWDLMLQVPVVYLQLCKALALPCCLADWMSIIQYPNPSSIIQSHRFAAPPNDFFSTHKFCCLEWATSKIRIPSSHLCRRNSRDSLLAIQDPVLLISTARQLWWRNPSTLSMTMISFSTVVWLLEV